MSLPRAVIPGRAYMITRRCSERRFFLRPDSSTNNAFIYCLAIAAKRYDMKVIFTVAMSNHHHTGLIDETGSLPEFLAYFHKLFAKHQNVLRGRWEAFWASEQTSVVELTGGEDMLEKMVYALTNPVKDQLVEKVHHWPGVSALSAILADKPLRATRPKTFFRSDGDMPETAELRFQRPVLLEGVCPSGLPLTLRNRIAECEMKAAAERAQTGHGVVGRAVVLRQHWNDSPRTREPRRLLNPRLACASVWRRVEALARNKAWLDAYKTARDLFLAGVESVAFPHGTFWLRRFAGVRCEPPPTVA